MQSISEPKRLPLFEPKRILVARATPRFVHLLYAPTNFCNLGCQYCYLGEGTDAPHPRRSPLTTLRYAIDQLLSVNIVPFNISFHGGEPTSIRANYLEELFSFTRDYYREHRDRIHDAGLRVPPIHIKTNLYNFDQLYELFERHKVSVSASVDLPLRLHDKYRTDKKGRSTLKKILDNLRLLSQYPHHKKTSCVISREHLDCTDEVVQDIHFIHNEIGLSMTPFNVMFGFESAKNEEKFGSPEIELQMLSSAEQVDFYHAMKRAFLGSDLEEGSRTHWFKEFTPDFCCSAVNCGDKFYLLQENGDVYSCPRGQSSPHFRYGNIYEDGVQSVFENGSRTIEAVENALDIHADCRNCEYLPYCNVGCTFVRQQRQSSKSYTCQLQKQLYRDAPNKYPPFSAEEVGAHLKNLLFRNNLKSVRPEQTQKRVFMNELPELHEQKNSLAYLIASDKDLQNLYSDEIFLLRIDGSLFPLQSPILSTTSRIHLLKPESEVLLQVREDVFNLCTSDATNNFLHLMLLRNTMVVYGDEQRTKQQHITDQSLYSEAFQSVSHPENRMRAFDLMPFLRLQQPHFRHDVRNNLFVTTRALRDVHYRKQQKNAFYHIQALNLPFQNVEFYWKSA